MKKLGRARGAQGSRGLRRSPSLGESSPLGRSRSACEPAPAEPRLQYCIRIVAIGKLILPPPAWPKSTRPGCSARDAAEAEAEAEEEAEADVELAEAAQRLKRSARTRTPRRKQYSYKDVTLHHAATLHCHAPLGRGQHCPFESPDYARAVVC